MFAFRSRIISGNSDLSSDIVAFYPTLGATLFKRCYTQVKFDVSFDHRPLYVGSEGETRLPMEHSYVGNDGTCASDRREEQVIVMEQSDKIRGLRVEAHPSTWFLN